MPFEPVILLTDAFIFGLLIMAAYLVWHVRQHGHLIEAWRQVGQRKVAMSAAVVLLFYVAIGVLDSMHFRPLADNTGDKVQYDTRVISVLDLALTQLREQKEKTYSAPFATHLYSKENIETSNGAKRDYPRLVYGGAHLGEGDAVAPDVALTLLKSTILGIAITLLIYLLMYRTASRLRWSRGVKGAHRVAWLTFAVMIVTLTALLLLSRDYHVLGTDKVGEDVLYQAIKSIRTGVVIGSLTTLVMLPAAIILGIMAGYFRGWVDDVIQYLYTTLSSVPGVLLIAAAVLMMQVYMSNNQAEFNTVLERSDMRLFFLCLILGITSWTGLCRLLRGETLKLGQLEYVQAAKAFGVSDWRILFRHITPNVMHIVLIVIVLDFSGLVLAEAVLSYINIGVDPNTHSWGNMINSARLELAREPVVWWSLLAAFVFMFILVLAANLLADAVRDAFDPRLKDQS